jgi:hypothetical protein
MNVNDGRVISGTEFEKLPEDEKRQWLLFGCGEVVTIKGVNFKIGEVSDRRLVLKFVEPQRL